MDLIKIYEYSGIPTHKLLKRLIELEFGCAEYEVIKHIIAKRYDRRVADFAREAVSQLIYEHQKNAENILPVKLGSKNSEYFTEEEMLKEFECNYSDLSKTEQDIFNNIEKGKYWNKKKLFKNGTEL